MLDAVHFNNSQVKLELPYMVATKLKLKLFLLMRVVLCIVGC